MPARTGQQYLDGLDDARDIWLDGERIADVRSHFALRRGVATMAELYDMQYETDRSDIMTYESPRTGDPVGTSFIIPKSPEDLRKRRRMMQYWTEHTCGMMGRSPDFVNIKSTSINMMGFALWHDYFGEKEPVYGDNIRNYYDYVREHDLCLTHTLLSSQIDRSKPPSAWPDPYLMLGVVKETDAGIIVRGARMLATLAPMSDEIAVYPSTVKRLEPHESRYAIMFSIPIATPGLSFICREPIDRGGTRFDHPLASRFEEMDCMAIFDNVLVPWERLFIYGDVDKHNLLFATVPTLGHVAHQMGVKNMVKTAFLTGLACELAESLGKHTELHIQDMLGEMTIVLCK